MRRCIQQWYLNKQPKHLAMLLTKYPQRGGWSHRDLLRLAHPKIADEHANADDLKALVRFVVESMFIFYSIKNNHFLGQKPISKRKQSEIDDICQRDAVDLSPAMAFIQVYTLIICTNGTQFMLNYRR